MPSQPRIVLVTGGAGFVGSHLVDELVRRGERVRVLDSLATGKRANLNAQAEVIEGDIRDLDAIRPVFAGVDCVFHTAAMARVPLSIEKPVETHAANATGTLNVLVAARDAKVRRVINSGSSSVYGDQPTLPLREDMAANPLNPYALQKFIAECYTRQFHQLYGMQTLTLRYFNVYGPRMTAEGAYLTVISIFLRQRKAGEPLTIEGDGEQTRDFTHVRDVVRANILAMDCDTADGRAINIGAGHNASINEIARMIGGPQVHRPPRRGDARNTLADNREAAKVLGWHPEVKLAQGIEELMRQAGMRA
ncbi:MAG TPA: NAD-dependent epimerase/dehydratase family protein [Candidatus Binataceae bacterium]|nr:NAD-dependent epimerase/dehydratase family protein [Candidatus Binataceae bacterium]